MSKRIFFPSSRKPEIRTLGGVEEISAPSIGGVPVCFVANRKPYATAVDIQPEDAQSLGFASVFEPRGGDLAAGQSAFRSTSVVRLPVGLVFNPASKTKIGIVQSSSESRKRQLFQLGQGRAFVVLIKKITALPKALPASTWISRMCGTDFFVNVANRLPPLDESSSIGTGYHFYVPSAFKCECKSRRPKISSGERRANWNAPMGFPTKSKSPGQLR